jgi:hypothetical protein
MKGRTRLSAWQLALPKVLASECCGNAQLLCISLAVVVVLSDTQTNTSWAANELVSPTQNVHRMFTHGATDVQLIYQLGKVGGALTMDDFIDHTVPFPSSCAA